MSTPSGSRPLGCASSVPARLVQASWCGRGANGSDSSVSRDGHPRQPRRITKVGLWLCWVSSDERRRVAADTQVVGSERSGWQLMLRLAARAGDRARGERGGGAPLPSPAGQAAMRTLALSGPTGRLLSGVASAWRQVAVIRRQEGRPTWATAAEAAAAAAHRAADAGAYSGELSRQPQRQADRDGGRGR